MAQSIAVRCRFNNMFSSAPISQSRLKKCFIYFFIIVLIIFCLIYQNSDSYQSSVQSNEIYKLLNVSQIDDIKADDLNNITPDFKNNSAESVIISPQLFYIETANCKVPYIDPYAAEVMDIYKPMLFETCSNVSNLVTPIFDMNRKQYVLHINNTVAQEILNSTDSEFNCYYQEITRSAESDSYNDPLSRIYFTDGYIIPLHVQGLILSCYEAANTSNIIQSDGYALIQYKSPPEAPAGRVTESQSEPVQRRKQPSVIMFGIDSMSRINLRRVMPKVYKFLTQEGWHEMEGYHKVADNTFPNLMATLSGYTPNVAKEHICDTDEKGCFDRLPFIWKFLKREGYLTAYAEDWSSLNTFNYIKPGFVEQPTDYFHRPYLKAFEDNFKCWHCADCTTNYCIGRRVQSSYVYDYMMEFAKRYINERPIWGFFWSTSFSHDSFLLPSKMENFTLQYLQDFETNGVYEESIVIFFSDHGARYGQLSHLTSGFLEERLPMMFIYLPPWFRAQYPEYAEALRTNRNRLTSHFDLHNTLKHIIELGRSTDAPPLPKAFSCPQCQSLFYPMSETRTCEEAGISDHYCTCLPYKRLCFSWSDRVAQGVVNRINEYLWRRNFTNLCANLTLRYIHKTSIQLGLDLSFHGELPQIDVAKYRTKFKVNQNSADFYATVIYNNKTDIVDVDVETISRTNSYEEDATCINDKLAKLYCICKSNLKDE